jgi:uncharacterized repeat protein (TIGR01451 family)
VTAATGDPDPADDTSTVTTTVTPKADLYLLKSGPAVVTAGGAIDYVIAVANDGPSDATDVVITDELPAALSSPTTSTSGCAIAGATGHTLTCAIGVVAASGTASVAVSATAPVTGTSASIVNTASVSSSTSDPDGDDTVASATTAIRPTVAVADTSVTEGGTASFTLTLSNPSSIEVTVDLTTGDGTAGAPGDYTTKAATVTIPAGTTVAAFTVATAADPVDEVDETFIATITGVSGAVVTDASGEGTIVDDDGAPSVSVGDVSVVEGGVATFTVTLSNPSSVDVVVGYSTVGGAAVSGTDFTSTSGSVTIPAGSTEATVDVATTPDTTDEGDETFQLDLTSATNGTLSPTGEPATGTILDDDGVPTVTIGDASAVEGGLVTFTLTLSNPSAQDVTVTVSTTNGTAVAPGDYTATSTTVTIPAGRTTGTVDVQTTGDTTDELDETFLATITDLTGATVGSVAGQPAGTGTGTIVDDDNSVTATDDPVATDEDTPVTFAPTGNDSDVDGDDFTVVGVTPPPAGEGAAVVNGDGTVTFTPAPDFHGTTTFTYTVQDARGATDTATVTVTVRAVNDRPRGTPDAYAVAPGTTLTVAGPGILGNDGDVDGDPLTAALATPPATGTLALRPDGSFTYLPAPGFSGPVTFTYPVTDGSSTSTPVTVTLTVAPGPVAAADAYTVGEDETLTVPGATGIFGNDQTAGGTAQLVTPPAHGTATVAPDGGLTYTPAPDFSGSDTLTYRICVGDPATPACSDPAVVTFTVTPAADAPLAVDDAVTTGPDGVAVIPVLGNDVDADGPVVGSVTVVAAPTKGTATVQPDGSIRYVAAPGAVGGDELTYRLCDGAGLCDDAQVRIEIATTVTTPPPVAPAAPAPVVTLPRAGIELVRLLATAALLLLAGTGLALVGRRRRRLTDEIA